VRSLKIRHAKFAQ